LDTLHAPITHQMRHRKKRREAAADAPTRQETGSLSTGSPERYPFHSCLRLLDKR
jgi:hypothetical protein